jgi:hypothetical protein
MRCEAFHRLGAAAEPLSQRLTAKRDKNERTIDKMPHEANGGTTVGDCTIERVFWAIPRDNNHDDWLSALATRFHFDRHSQQAVGRAVFESARPAVPDYE